MTKNNLNPYTPSMPAADWAIIGPFVSACVEASSSNVVYGKPELFTAASALTRWTWRTAGLPLDPAAVFDRDVIDRFVSSTTQYTTMASKSTMRSRLLRMSESLLAPGLVIETLRPLGASSPSSPYSRSEQAALRSWAASQPTPQKRKSAGALLGLGIGSGLSGKEIIQCKNSDVTSDLDGVVINVTGARPRRVPVIREWEENLRVDEPISHGDRPLFRPGQSGDNPNLITDFVSRSRGKIALQARRMRSTWIVHHLNVGTPTLDLLSAAGVQTLESFDRFVQFADQREWDTVRSRLRG